MRYHRLLFLALFLPISVGCYSVSSPGNIGLASNYTKFDEPPDLEEDILLGVVSGIYKLDEEKTREVLDKYFGYMSIEEKEELSNRYLVRVGIDRQSMIASSAGWITGIGVAATTGIVLVPTFGFKSSDFAFLPEGYHHDPFNVSEIENIVNVGDIVEIKSMRGRIIDTVVRVVRQCYEPPGESENHDWSIGCKVYEEFNKSGFAGEKYYLRMF